MKNKFILLIEDNQHVSEALVWSLEYEGYNVSTARNGKEGLILLENDPLPSIIFLDLMMPFLDGYQFRQIQKKDPRINCIPTIITSAKNSLDQTKIKLTNEIVLPKPFNLEELMYHIKKYCH